MRSPGSPKCPGDDELLGAFLLELDPVSRERVAGHAASCPLCRKKQIVLAEIAEELRARSGPLPDSLGPDEETALRDMAGAEVRRLRGEGRRRRILQIVPVRATVAAAVLITAAAAGIFYFARTRPEDVDRGVRTGVRLLEPAGKLPRAPSVFRWDAVRNADGYGFEIYDEELRPVLDRRVKTTSVTLAPGETGSFKPGRDYYWDVEAFDDEGRPLASGRGSFSVAPGGAPD